MCRRFPRLDGAGGERLSLYQFRTSGSSPQDSVEFENLDVSVVLKVAWRGSHPAGFVEESK